MTLPILHHFDASPFAEKIRLVLGFHGIEWRDVKIPMVMPKPDVIALTGGYRRTPVLQMNADVYVDTSLIARVLDRIGQGPTLYPASAPLAIALAQWADWQLFWTVIDFASQPLVATFRWRDTPKAELDAIMADRAPFRAPVPKQSPADATANLANHLAMLAEQVADGRSYVFGLPTIADFSVAHVLWHLRRAGPLADEMLAPHPVLRRWHDQLLAGGHGTHAEITSTEALAVAAGSDAHVPCTVEQGMGFKAGQPVAVAAMDYGTDWVLGKLMGLTRQEIVIERNDPRAGKVHVHFPRHGYQLKVQD